VREWGLAAKSHYRLKLFSCFPSLCTYAPSAQGSERVGASVCWGSVRGLLVSVRGLLVSVRGGLGAPSAQGSEREGARN